VADHPEGMRASSGSVTVFYVVAQYEFGDYLRVGFITTDRNKAEAFMKKYALMRSHKHDYQEQSWVITEVEDGEEFPDLG